MNQSLKTLQYIHTGIIGFQIVLIGVFVILNLQGGADISLGEDVEKILGIATPALALILIFSVRQLGTVLLKGARESGSLKEKLGRFQTLCFIRWGMFEFVVVIAALAYFFTGSLTHLLVALVIVFISFARYPSAINISQELQLSKEEQDQLVA